MNTVSYNDFKKLDIRVVKVVSAENIPGKDRIFKITVDTGEDETRSIVVGGAEYYNTEYFLAKKYVAVLNLDTKKIANIESQGMLLAALSNGKPLWLTVDDTAPIGAKVI